jgi:aminoacyl-tRNA hydrolase
MVVDRLAAKLGAEFQPTPDDYLAAEIVLPDEATGDETRCALLKPLTYMNRSGIAAFQAFERYDADIPDFLAIYDDTALPLGTVRTRNGGGDGGHNGVKSLLERVDRGFPRLRVGVGDDFPKGGLVDYVLDEFADDEAPDLERALERAERLAEAFAKGGAKLMFDLNARLVQEEKASERANEESDERNAASEQTDVESDERPDDEPNASDNADAT